MSTSSASPEYQKYKNFVVSAPSAGVAHVEINRPKKLNAFARDVWLEFGAVFEQLSADADVRAVVLSGAGDKAFTAGLDVVDSAGMFEQKGLSRDVARRAKALRATIEEFQVCVGAMEKCEKPVICVLHGVSFGLAIDIATCADIRICAANTRFSVKEVDIGIAADVGTLARLPKVVGSTSWVKDVCMSAREFSAQEALSVGFVSAVHEDKGKAVGAALAMAARLSEKSPVAVQGTKELLNYGRDHGTVDSLRYTTIWNSANVQSEDFQKALLSGLKRTKPTFEKL
ncbi:unnamed protein product [Clonostachys byssicola]|uniref:Delta(3,5)-Delta(2,4)-dienoyl-CoA isomerase n=1 Tax=Clonostachys byssicola TaxID=160290 RepID=A0A9N9UWF6_9HYPO|nr:unnamed protein product [Clonostachys byssicola]